MNTFTFPGFGFLRDMSTETHDVEVGAIMLGNQKIVAVKVIRKAEFRGETSISFLASAVYSAGGANELWNFKQENHKGLGLLAQTASAGPVIALVEGGHFGSVVRTISLLDIFHGTRNQDIAANLTTKREAAEFLGRGFIESNFETSVREALELEERKARLAASAEQIKKRSEEAAQRTAAAEQERKQKAEQQRQRTAEIMGRKKVEAFSLDGQIRRGIPVMAEREEWQWVTHGTYVISRDAQGSMEWFKVERKHGQNAKKKDVVKVCATRPTMLLISGSEVREMPKPIKAIMVVVNGKALGMDLYESSQDISEARSLGLNGNTYVATPAKDGRVNVYEVSKDGIKTTGVFVPAM